MTSLRLIFINYIRIFFSLPATVKPCFLLFNETISCMYTQVHVRLNFSGFLQLVLFWGQVNCSLGVKMITFLEKVQGKCNRCIGISDGGEEWSRGSQIFSDAHGQKKRQWSKTETHKMTHFMAQVACRACGVSMLGDTHRPGQLTGWPCLSSWRLDQMASRSPFPTSSIFCPRIRDILWLVSVLWCTDCWRWGEGKRRNIYHKELVMLRTDTRLSDVSFFCYFRSNVSLGLS